MPVDPPRTGGEGTPERPPKPCPICGKLEAAPFRPFCSSRCRSVDLNRWFSGSYVVPGRDDEDEAE